MASVEPKTVTISRDNRENDIVKQLQVSQRKGQNYFLPKHSHGVHFENQKQVKEFFERKYPNAEIKID